MHDFTELVDICAGFTLNALEEANDRVMKELETSSATRLVKALQMVQLQKVILAVGMFSIFEAHLQTVLDCNNGFSAAKKILEDQGEYTLKERFDVLFLAVNVLKHGQGKSYNTLIGKAQSLPFKIKPEGESFFDEGDVSEVSTLIEVDDAFVLLCSKVISDVSKVIEQLRSDVLYKQ